MLLESGVISYGTYCFNNPLLLAPTEDLNYWGGINDVSIDKYRADVATEICFNFTKNHHTLLKNMNWFNDTKYLGVNAKYPYSDLTNEDLYSLLNLPVENDKDEMLATLEELHQETQLALQVFISNVKPK